MINPTRFHCLFLEPRVSLLVHRLCNDLSTPMKLSEKSTPNDSEPISTLELRKYLTVGSKCTIVMKVEQIRLMILAFFIATSVSFAVKVYDEKIEYLRDVESSLANATYTDDFTDNAETLLSGRIPRDGIDRKEVRVDFGRDAVIRKIDPNPAELRIEDVNNRTFSARMLAEVLEDGPASELEDLARITSTDIIQTRTLFVDINAATSLIVRPGTLARIIFDVTNSHSLTVRHYFQARSSTFSVANLQPRDTWINSGQTTSVAVDVIIPATTSDSAVDTITLYVQGIETVEKSTYVYVTSSTSVAITDTTKPSVSYSFNDNCSGKLDSDRCSKSRWSVEVTATDSGTGLQRVTSLPTGIYPITTFVSGTKSSVTFYYTATCCDTTVQVTASDLLGNSNTQTIDVTVWTNLTQGEIAAIVLGILILLLLIILVVLIIIYFIRKRKSLDLPYTQRYGSRTAPRPERTSF